MSDEKLPPGPGLCVHCGARLPHRFGERCGMFTFMGEEQGAIVRKAEVPTCKPWCGVNLPIHHGCVAGTCWTLLAPNGDWHFDSEACRDAGRPLHPAAEAPTFAQFVAKVGPLESNAMATAETPTCEWLIPTGETLGGSLAGVHVGRKCPEPRIDGDELCAIHARRRPAAEQPSGNTGGLPTPQCTGPFADWCPVHPRPGEAPAAPVSEPTQLPISFGEEAALAALAEASVRIAELMNELQSAHSGLADACATKDARDARIAALEAELDEANDRRDHEWYARLQPAVEVAVQAERERATAHADILVMDIETQDKHADPCPLVRSSRDRIKNGDPAP